MPAIKKSPSSSKLLTPLAIIAAFVGLVETILTVGLVKTSGLAQDALVIFVIIFPAIVAAGFFYVLWSRPENFYHPSEYGNTNPESFIAAMRARISQSLIQPLETEELKVPDQTGSFPAMASLIDVAVKQHLILLHVIDRSIPLNMPHMFSSYQTGKADGSFQTGHVSGAKILEEVGGSGFVEVVTSTSEVQLTELGKRFAMWLTATGEKSDYYTSNYGGWGTVPAEISALVQARISPQRQTPQPVAPSC